MNMVQFDTLEYANKLKVSGVSEEQAEGMTEAMRQVLESKELATKQDIKDSELATKRDIKALEVATKQDIKALEASTKIELEKVRGDIKAVEASTKVSISESKVEMIKWMVGMFVIQTGILIAAIIAAIKILSP